MGDDEQRRSRPPVTCGSEEMPRIAIPLPLRRGAMEARSAHLFDMAVSAFKSDIHPRRLCILNLAIDRDELFR
jgi:hypothetical protein